MKLNFHTHFFTVIVLVCFTYNQVHAQVKPQTLGQIQLLLNEKESRTPVQRKIDSRLLQAVKESRGEKLTSGVSLRPAKVNKDARGNLMVDIGAAVSDALINRIQVLGAKIIYPSIKFNTIRAEVNLLMVETIAGYREVRFIEPAVLSTTVGPGKPKGRALRKETGPLINNSPFAQKPGKAFVNNSFETRADRVRVQMKDYLRRTRNLKKNAAKGTVNAEGDRTHRADDTRNTYGYEGQGIRIGVLSDSYNSLGDAASDIASGNLPGSGNPIGNTTPVTVLADIGDGSDEGRAMLQIIHDLAPKAQLFFATAFISEASFAENILALRGAPYNCDIIIDDVSYYDEPAFQDGMVAQAVNTVTANGGLYFSSAGNSGSLAKNNSGVWEGDFNDEGAPAFTFSDGEKEGTIHNFGTVTLPVGGNVIVEEGTGVYNLQWADPWGRSANDYDLFLVDSGGTVISSSTNIQSGTQRPYEQIPVSPLDSGDRLVVFKTTTSEVRAFSLNTNRGVLTYKTAGQTHGHSAAVDAFSVAATPAKEPFSNETPPGPFPQPFNATNQVEVFSSDGPRRIFFNADTTPVTPGNFLFQTNGGTVRAKPDITAADGVSTTLSSTSGLNPFYGTSASAPHAGAIAALLKSANPSLTTTQIRTFLTNNALDIEFAGYDNTSGFGIIQSFQAMQQLAPSPLSNIILDSVSATEGSFRNNNGIIEPGELANIIVRLKNPSLAAATGVKATLTTTTPGVTVTTDTALFATITPMEDLSNTIKPFVIGINNSVLCGTTLHFILNVTFGGGGPSPQGFFFSVTVGSQPFKNISSTLGSVPPSGPGFTSATGVQTGRINRSTAGEISSCDAPKESPGLASATGSRQFDAYSFVNNNTSSQCVTATMSSPNGNGLFTVVYNNGGFVPIKPDSNYLGDAGNSYNSQTFSFTAPPGDSFTIVIHAVNPQTAVGSPYTLNVSLSNCSAGPACNPVDITTNTIAAGAVGTFYSQSFTATGGSNSGSYAFMLVGNLPAGLAFQADTLKGIPTQAGTFAIKLVADDPVGCTADTMYYTLVIKGITPFSVTATAGAEQTTFPLTDFPTALQATVSDSIGRPLSGVNVIFAAPDAGASGSFPGGLQTVTIVTDSNGVATAPTFTANAISGSYVVTASVEGIHSSAKFNLNNFCPANFIVTSSADSGPGTLRDIIKNVCTGITVTFDKSISLINLTSGELDVDKAITIAGPGADKLTISGNNLSRIFNIAANTDTVTIEGMTITEGLPQETSNGGGGVLIKAGIVKLTRCVITANDASLTDFGEGGGIDNEENGIVIIDKCTIANNKAIDDGGGIANWGISMGITNSTITGNALDSTGLFGGGGIFSFVPLTIVNSTIFGNSAFYGGNLFNYNDTISFRNTIIAGGELVGSGGVSADIYGSGYKSDGFNLIQDTSGSEITGITSTSNIIGLSPRLLQLGQYTGAIPVHLPHPNSPVINTGDTAALTGTDQRELPRVVGRRADIGAVEANYNLTATGGTPQSTFVKNDFKIPLQARVAESGNPVEGVNILFSAPATGPSGTFENSFPVATATTGTTGIATAPVFTANSSVGTYNVRAAIGTEFSEAVYTLTNTAVLPVTFGTVGASSVNCGSQITWETMTEVNSSNFAIEFSTDGVRYTSIDTILSTGNSTTKQVYTFTHTTTSQGTNYYRIRQTDKDGRAIYSPVVTVNNNCNNLPMVAYPNPVRDKLTVVLGGTNRQTLLIFDASGRKITQYAFNGGTHTISTRSWAKGMYTLSVTQKGKPAYLLKVIKD